MSFSSVEASNWPPLSVKILLPLPLSYFACLILLQMTPWTAWYWTASVFFSFLLWSVRSKISSVIHGLIFTLYISPDFSFSFVTSWTAAFMMFHFSFTSDVLAAPSDAFIFDLSADQNSLQKVTFCSFLISIFRPHLLFIYFFRLRLIEADNRLWAAPAPGHVFALLIQFRKRLLIMM